MRHEATYHSGKAVAAAGCSRLELPKAGIWATPDGAVHLILPKVYDRHQGSPRLQGYSYKALAPPQYQVHGPRASIQALCGAANCQHD